MQGIDVAMMILCIVTISRGQYGIEEVFAPTAFSCDPEHGETRICQWAEIPAHGDVVGEAALAQQNEVPMNPAFLIALLGVLHAHSPARERNRGRALSAEAGEVFVRGQRVLV